MMEKLRAHYLKWGPRRFVVVTVVALFVTDLLNSCYLRLYWRQKGLSGILVHQSITRGHLSLEDFSPETLAEMTGFVDNSFTFFLFLILANNAFFYLFYLRKKLWAQGYVLFYTLTAALFSVSFVLDNAGLGLGWFTYNVLTLPFYVYLYFGVKVLKPETTIIPAGGKKGR